MEVKTFFKDWIQRYIKRYDFIEGVDYVCCSNLSGKTGSGGHNIKEYYISLDMAKELAMVQNNLKGKQARQYFIQCEKIAKAAIRREFNKEWKQLREDGKTARREATDAIQEFYDYAKGQGSEHPWWYYKSITNAIYDACISGGSKEIDRRKKELKKKNGKDTMTIEELIKVELMERLVVKKSVKEALESNKFYKEVYTIMKESLLHYGEMIEKRLSLEMNNQQRIAVNG